ncbi:DNA primase small subunit [Zancudomyces culisetae]|uniref:DNA primase small subunit n=1 Tax=Zancudomyces culisetae TaxID=1213189 RepID=A0A1R1PFD3_ZANCU|nr:DNA primase small subunit [Zancudomyces culisetae]|eukprot:OMH79677.1 DNA primase small subunit [Zancudomyces culisetae]
MDGVEQEGGDSNISVGRWEEILQEIKTYNEENKKNKNIRAVPESLIDEIKLQHVYPRLDENVTTHINHLLKSPFCIHPKTGKVCVPIPVGELDRFKPDNVPTIHQLLDSTADGGDQARDQLKKYTNYFETFVKRSIMLNNSGNEGGSVDDW